MIATDEKTSPSRLRRSESHEQPAGLLLPLQQIDWFLHVVHAEIFCERWVFSRYCFVHRVRSAAIRHMSGGPGAQLRNVDNLGEVHLKQRALAITQRDGVLRVLQRFFSRP